MNTTSVTYNLNISMHTLAAVFGGGAMGGCNLRGNRDLDGYDNIRTTGGWGKLMQREKRV